MGAKTFNHLQKPPAYRTEIINANFHNIYNLSLAKRTMEEYISPQYLQERIKTLKRRALENIELTLSTIEGAPRQSIEWRAILSGYKDWLELLALVKLYETAFDPKATHDMKSMLEKHLNGDEKVIMYGLTGEWKEY